MTYTLDDCRVELDNIKRELGNSGFYVVYYEDVLKMLDALEETKQ